MLTETLVMSDWNMLPDDTQLVIARAAMRRAAEAMAGHAEMLAGEIETGEIADHGGPSALRLLAAVVRLSGQDLLVPAGSA
jgi:hypothetical protein